MFVCLCLSFVSEYMSLYSGCSKSSWDFVCQTTKPELIDILFQDTVEAGALDEKKLQNCVEAVIAFFIQLSLALLISIESLCMKYYNKNVL